LLLTLEVFKFTKAGFRKMLRNIQAEAREFVSYKKDVFCIERNIWDMFC